MKALKVLPVAAALVIVPTLPAHAAASPLSAPVDAGDKLGSGAAVSGSWAAFGAPGDGAGAVHVYRFSGGRWRWSQVLRAPGGRSGDELGASLAIAGNHLVAGAPGDDGRRGSASFFVRSGSRWVFATKVVGGKRAKDDSFGNSVAIWRDRAVIGAWHHGGKAFYDTPFTGSAYVFERTDGRWKQVKRLVPTDAQAEDGFGTSVAIERNLIAVGAWHQDENEWNAGAVYLFKRSDGRWRENYKLMAGQSTDHFGISVAISDASILVGAWDDDSVSFNAGAAYVFVKADPPPPPPEEEEPGALDPVTGLLEEEPPALEPWVPWVMQAKLTAADGKRYDLLGNAVALDGDRAVVGAWRHDGRGSNAGAAYVFERTGTTWSRVEKLQPVRGSKGARFGSAVGISGERIVVGAARADDHGSSSGAAYEA